MNDSSQMQFKIGIVGPTSVGKTSLITSILKNSESLLAGTPLVLKELDLATERRVATYQRELEGSILAGEFNPGALSSTQEPFKFNLELDPGVPYAGIRISLLDYPGGWLDPVGRPQNRELEWNECKSWIAESTLLLIPVEATVLMEADTARRLRSLPSILTTDVVAKAARDWAKRRAERKEEPALLLVCPVKCESYFDDNGGRRNRSEDLYTRVNNVYKDVFRAVREEAQHVEIVYSPVDTIGCVEVIQGYWTENNTDGDKGLEFSADYMVRNPGRQNVVGADTVLAMLCKHLVTATTLLKEKEQRETTCSAEAAREYAEKHEGWFWNLVYWINGEREQRRKKASRLEGKALEQYRRVESLRQVVQDLAKRPMGPRVRKL